jgi:hypothetical protein
VYLAYRVIKRAWEQPAVLVKTGFTLPELYTTSLILMRLEKVGDQAKRIARTCLTANVKPADCSELKKQLVKIELIYGEVMKAYYNKDIETSFEIGTACAEQLTSVMEMQSKYRQVPIAMIAEQMKNMLSSIRHVAQNVSGGVG